MGQCDEIKYGDLDWCEGQVQLPGIRGKVYCCAKRDIVAFPTRQAATISMGDLARLLGSFVLASGVVWREIGVIVDKSPITSVSQGTKPSKSFLTTATFAHQELKKKQLHLLNKQITTIWFTFFNKKTANVALLAMKCSKQTQL